MRSLIDGVLGDFRRCWKKLFLTDVFYKVIAFVLLTPLVAVLFRVFISMSGNTVLADQDVLFFFLAPVGWLCLITVGALWLGIVALEQAALMGILATPKGKRIGVIDALRFASASVWSVSQVTARLIACTLLAAAPFGMVAAAVYFALLTEFDINFYLKEKPPVFQIAVGIGVVLGVMLGALLLRLFTGWIFALPLVVFEDVSPSVALKVSRERATGSRRTLLAAIVIWGLSTIMLSTLTTTAVIAVGRFFVPRAAESLGLLTMAIGASLLLWTVVNLAVNLLSTTAFAALLLNLYRHFGSGGEIDTWRLKISDTAEARGRFQITQKRVLVASILGVAVAGIVGVIVAQSVRLEDNVEIMAHRGSSKSAPENTMAAVRKAIEDGTDWVEIDVQETADGKVVVFHDSDFMKLSGVNLKIWDATMADLKDIDVGSRFSPEFKQERVPTLAQVLQECKGKIGVNIELKYYGHDQKLEQRVVDIVQTNGMTDSVIFMSLKLDAVKKIKSLRPTWKVGLLMSVSAGDLSSIEADFLAVNAGFVDRGFVRKVHAIGKEVYVWTVNDAVSMSTMIGRGVDGLITDRPALARSVLQQRAEMSPAERLIIELAETFGVAREIGQQ
jgi:glycerophosphoryl diester phosphodiesterase